MHTSTSTTLRALLSLALCILPAAPLGGCGGDSGATVKKAGGKKGSAAADAKQKSGDTATGNRSSGTDQGAESDGIVCDANLEGVGWCSSDAAIVLCAEGSWWLVDCSAVSDGAYCGYDEDADVVDCYVEE